MTRGCFIALEGGDGTGKSTQARLLAEALRQKGIEVVVTREPGGTPGAEAIRELLFDPPGEIWGAEAEALLFAAARSDHVANRILPALEGGEWVVTDRFVDSSRAYQGAARWLGDAVIKQLHEIGSGGLRPDLVILIELDENTIAQRPAERDDGSSDAIGRRDDEYHREVARAFRSYAEADPEGYAIIDGTGTSQEVHQRVIGAVKPLLER
ncbi:MAG TPA: dTMP kinase [Erythrobacter sp.]|nr:dTMP kinase [Erythrobacter sp.]